ncbi:MAG: SDR family oxidoreductase [Pseudoxanthomonas sp.]
MKIVVVGGRGFIGARLVSALTRAGHEAASASLSTGVDTVSGEGLLEAIDGADAVVDAANSPSYDGEAAAAFFQTSTRNLLEAAKAVGVRHYVALSMVGADQLAGSGYFGAKLLQEERVRDSGLPYTVVRSTHSYELTSAIIPSGSAAEVVRLPTAWIRPVAADDLAEALARIASAAPIHAVAQIAGPERFRLSELIQWIMYAYQDLRTVAGDPDATYYGAVLEEQCLLPSGHAHLGSATFADWLGGQLAAKVQSSHVHRPRPYA